MRRGFDHGSALLITGEAGVGKTALLDRVVSDMTDGTLGVSLDTAAGVGLVRAAGVEFETDVSYAALNELLLPLREAMSGVHSPARAALAVALGLEQGPSSDRLLVATAALTLLRQAGEHRPPGRGGRRRLVRTVPAPSCSGSWLDDSGGSQVALARGHANGGRDVLRAQRACRPTTSPRSPPVLAADSDRYHPASLSASATRCWPPPGQSLALHELAATVQDIPSGTLPDAPPAEPAIEFLFEMRVRRLPTPPVTSSSRGSGGDRETCACCRPLMHTAVDWHDSGPRRTGPDRGGSTWRRAASLPSSADPLGSGPDGDAAKQADGTPGAAGPVHRPARSLAHGTWRKRPSMSTSARQNSWNRSHIGSCSEETEQARSPPWSARPTSARTIKGASDGLRPLRMSGQASRGHRDTRPSSSIRRRQKPLTPLEPCTRPSPPSICSSAATGTSPPLTARSSASSKLPVEARSPSSTSRTSR